MRISLETSPLMRLRLNENLSQSNIDRLSLALESRDFPAFAEITMRESNALHAVCLDTYPPIFYMNETSKQIIKAATAMNSERIRVAYSIDAGFHVFVFTQKEDA
jgi:diphosphomevalonate decarboxylase